MHRKYSERSELGRLFACQRFIRGIKCRSFASLPCATVQRYFKILRYRHTSLSVLQHFHPKLHANSIFGAKYPLFVRYTQRLCYCDTIARGMVLRGKINAKRRMRIFFLHVWNYYLIGNFVAYHWATIAHESSIFMFCTFLDLLCIFPCSS